MFLGGWSSKRTHTHTYIPPKRISASCRFSFKRSVSAASLEKRGLKPNRWFGGFPPVVSLLPSTSRGSNPNSIHLSKPLTRTYLNWGPWCLQEADKCGTRGSKEPKILNHRKQAKKTGNSRNHTSPVQEPGLQCQLRVP